MQPELLQLLLNAAALLVLPLLNQPFEEVGHLLVPNLGLQAVTVVSDFISLVLNLVLGIHLNIWVVLNHVRNLGLLVIAVGQVLVQKHVMVVIHLIISGVLNLRTYVLCELVLC